MSCTGNSFPMHVEKFEPCLHLFLHSNNTLDVHCCFHGLCLTQDHLVGDEEDKEWLLCQ